VVPALFYRGRVALTQTTPVPVTIAPTKEPITITLRQDPKSIPKGYRDQFLVHPSLGALHFGTYLNYIVDLTNNTDETKNVKLSGQFDGERAVFEAVTLKPHESTRRWPREKWISGHVVTLDKDFTPTEKPEQPQYNKLLPHEVPRHRDRTLTLNAFANDGRKNPDALAPEHQIIFRQLEVEDYSTARAYFNPDDKMVYVEVLHKGNDPVQGPLLKVVASVSGMVQESSKLITHGNGWQFWFPVHSQELDEVKWYVDVGYKKQAFYGKVKLREKPADATAAKKDKKDEAGAGGDAP
jgi:hypothetical protein